MRWLNTVSFDDLHPAMLLAAMRLQEIYDHYSATPNELWITSGNDKQHVDGSKHYSGRALDFRTKNIPGIDLKLQIEEKIRAALGPQFTVLLEDLGQPNEHLHIQFNGH